MTGWRRAGCILMNGERVPIFTPVRTPSIINSSRILDEVADHDLYLDVDQFKRLGGRYIFSRIKDLGNAEEIGLTLIGIYTDEASPYTLYVYQTTSRYRDVDHANLTLEEMKQTTCDMELLDAQLTEMKELAAEAEAAGEAKDPERVKELFEETLDEVEKLVNLLFSFTDYLLSEYF